jgi:outer membrane biosynthesis protein TonB
MKAQLLMLSAAGLLLAASAHPSAAASAATSASGAAPTELQLFTAQAEARADRLLIDAGIQADDPPVSVRANLASDGHVTGLDVVRSSGSRDIDRKVQAILQRVLLSNPPVGLINGAVTLNVGAGHAAAAAAR